MVSSSSVITPPTQMVEVVSVASPLDAVPSHDGATLYFTALGPEGGAAWAVDLDTAGAVPVALTAEGALVMPLGLALSEDGTRVFVADLGALSAQEQGAVVVVPAAGGAVSMLAGTEDHQPRAVAVALDDLDGETIYFTGILPGSTTPAVFKVPSRGGVPTVVHQGAPLREPSGLQVSRHGGSLVVVDILAGASGMAQVFQSAAPEGLVPLGPPLLVGYPAGITQGDREGSWRISALDLISLRGVVLDLDGAGNLSVLSLGEDPAGEPAGLHRSRDASITAWVHGAESGGRVVVLK